MRRHFGIAIWARDVVIAGELEPLRGPLRELASTTYATGDDASRGQLEQLQRAAAAASAETLAEAARHVSRIAGHCGECHRQHGRGPQIEVEPQPIEEAAETPADRMLQHRLGADQLWKGLIGPSTLAYRQGAHLIAHAPEVPSDSRYALAWWELEAVAERAEQAEALEARVEAYAELLAQCGQCHSTLERGSLLLCDAQTLRCGGDRAQTLRVNGRRPTLATR